MCKIHHNAQQSDNNSSFTKTRINIQGNIGATGVSGQGEEGIWISLKRNQVDY